MDHLFEVPFIQCLVPAEKFFFLSVDTGFQICCLCDHVVRDLKSLAVIWKQPSAWFVFWVIFVHFGLVVFGVFLLVWGSLFLID